MPPFALIHTANQIARDFHAEAARRADNEAETLAEAARAIWRAISALEATARRRKPGEARTMRSLQRAMRRA